MKPNFALSLLPEGITLLHRAAGGWRRVGTVPLDAPDMKQKLEAMRRLALALEPGGLRSKVVIPNDQIRYMSLDTGPINVDARWQAARQAMEGATPYALDELAIDISVDGPVTHVAAVARETLQEAEAFAVQHLFHPVSFVAIPGEHPFVGEPFFGPSEHAATLPGGAEVTADDVAIVVIGDAIPPPLPAGSAADGTDMTDSADMTDTRADAAATEPRAEGTATGAGPQPDFASCRKGAGGTAASGTATPAAPLPEAPRRLQIGLPGREAPPATGASETVASATTEAEQRPPATTGAERRNLPEAPPLVQPDPSGTPRITPVSPRIEDLAPDDETGRLTLFGARRPAALAAPRRRLHPGLILALVLLAVLALVAIWAVLFLDDGLAGLFRRDSTASPAVAEAPVAAGTGTEGPAAATRPEAPAADSGRARLRPGPEVNGIGPRQPVASASQDGPPDLLPETDLPAPRQQPPRQPPDAADDPVVADTGPGPGRAGPETAQAPRNRQGKPGTDGNADGALDLAAALTPERADAIYAASGIWLTPPRVPETPSIISLEDLYVATIDRTDLPRDAVALPATGDLDTDRPPVVPNGSTVPGRPFAQDGPGLVEPSPEGTPNPDGILVYAGRPPVVPPPTPPRAAPEQGAGPEAERLRRQMAAVRPRPRPAELVDAAPPPETGGDARLTAIRPRPRPATETPAPAREPAAPAAVAGGTDLAVGTAPRPPTRPAGLAAARPATGASATAAAVSRPQSAAPPARTSGRTSATVARHATAENVISLRKINLIGVFGTPSNRRALVRLPSGRYQKVKIGDRLDGGRVIAIGERELRYQKKGRNLTLKLPRG